MLTIIKNANVLAPRALGTCDVVICDGRIAAIDTDISLSANNLDIEIIDAQKSYLVPGFVDSLVHITGGGGEGGFNTRTPEITIKDAVYAGVTSMVGALGTDVSTRKLGDLYGKAKALTQDGISCFMYTGSYHVPVETLMGNIRDDIVFIDPIIGVGEIAISDHRGSTPSARELARIAGESRVGGMISGKSGIVSIHVGSGEEYLDLLHEAVAISEVPISQFYPTHTSRSETLLQRSIEFARLGGTIDFTASTSEQILEMGEIRASEALATALDAGVSPERLTISSDAQGSLPSFDNEGILKGLQIGRINSIHEEFALAVNEYKVPIEKALTAVTRNPASILGLKRKGNISQGRDADILLLNPEDLSIESVMAKGSWLLRDNKLVLKTPFINE